MKFPKLLLFIGALLCTSISSKLWSQLNYLETSQGDNNIISLCSEEFLKVTATAIGCSNTGYVFNRIRGGVTSTIQNSSPDGDIVLYPDQQAKVQMKPIWTEIFFTLKFMITLTHKPYLCPPIFQINLLLMRWA